MKFKIDRYIARNPRHLAAEEGGFTCRVERDEEQTPREVEGQLADLSRTGVQLTVAEPLEIGEAAMLQLGDPDSPASLRRGAVLRWQQPAGEGAWSLGFEFRREVEWETLGEFFLGNILSTDIVP